MKKVQRETNPAVSNTDSYELTESEADMVVPALISPPLPVNIETEDRVRIERLRADDKAALTELLTEYRTVIYWTAYGVTKSQPDSEEITADTFITLWKKRRTISLHGESALPWLITTCRFLAKNRARSLARHPQAALEDHANQARSEDFTEASDLHVALARAVSSLAPVDAAIYRLCLEEGLSYQSAAETLGVSHATVRNRLSRLRQTLQSALTTATSDTEK